jgi:uncharacterized protein (TIGR00251 family)
LYILCRNGIRINVHVAPGAARDEFAGRIEGRLKVRISARAVDGRANQKLCEFLSAKFLVAKSCVSILGGHSSRRKSVFIAGPPETLSKTLVQLL